MKNLPSILFVIIVATPIIARAHHGVAAVGIAGLEGPGAGLETTSPITLPAKIMYLMLKYEHVPFQKIQFVEPNNIRTFDFYTLAAGYGITPYLSAYVFLPYSVKTQESLGTTSGFADMNLMLTLGFKYDERFLLIPENETLDDLMDWHFSVSLASTLPTGSTTHKDKHGEYFEPEMQNGFGSMSPAIYLAVMKRLNDDLTWLADVSFQYFLEHKYPASIRYQFGAEIRVDTSLAYRILSKGSWRIDLIAEANLLNIQHDRSNKSDTSDELGSVKSVRASGGTIVYGTAGVRVFYDRFTLAIGIKKALFSSLNDKKEQQGTEGLEDYRLFATVGYCFGL